MNEWQSSAARYIAQLKGPDREDAYHCLIELDHNAVPILIEAFKTEKDSTVRSLLVESVWQHRLPSSLNFLLNALNDPDPDVWKSALDGLVTLGGEAVAQGLESAKRSTLGGSAPPGQTEWLDEAIEQVKAGRWLFRK